MKTRSTSWRIWLFFFSILSLSSARAETTLFTNVNVIPMDRNRILKDQMVLVEDSNIAYVGSALPQQLENRRNAFKVIDATGQYLMPGLVDMHVHFGRELFEGSFTLYLANGVTTVREMSTTHPALLQIREQIKDGKRFGPNLILASPASGGWGGDPNDIWTWKRTRDALHSYIANGYDSFKVYDNFTPDVYAALVNEAKRLGFPIGGHVPRKVSVSTVLSSGQNTIEHLSGFNVELEPDDSPLKGDESQLGRLLYRGAYQDPVKLKRLVNQIMRSKTWLTPTSFIDSVYANPWSLDEILTRPEMRYMPRKKRDEWNDDRIYLQEEMKDKKAILRAYTRNFNRTLSLLAKRGARFLVGSDSWNETAMVPGFSIHDELKMLKRGGLSNYQILTAATSAPLASLPKTDEKFGKILRGFRADLILLKANPLANIQNLKKRTGVMIRGRWVSEAEIQSRLRDLEIQNH